MKRMQLCVFWADYNNENFHKGSFVKFVTRKGEREGRQLYYGPRSRYNPCNLKHGWNAENALRYSYRNAFSCGGGGNRVITYFTNDL